MIKIIKENILLIFLLCFIGLLSTKSNAEDNPFWNKDLFVEREVKLFCGPTSIVFESSQKVFGESNVANGIIDTYENGIPTGVPIGIMSFWYNNEKNSGTFYITILETNETCVASYGTGMKWNENYMLDIINKEIANDS